jgi:hypothetical protein
VFPANWITLEELLGGAQFRSAGVIEEKGWSWDSYAFRLRAPTQVLYTTDHTLAIRQERLRIEL